MNNIIKCPICHEMAGLRYNENRVYQSRCQNMACRETVTVTAPSGKAAEELFSKFEKRSIQPKLSIPKKIAEELDKFFEIDFESLGHEEWWIQEHELIEWFSKTPNCYIKDAYLAGKALGVELVEVEG
ncbi:hypothetical protein LMK05_05675 [Lactococcus petauri]|nr:hypothetical protein LMK05_05675 [Lactococcus petauri]